MKRGSAWIAFLFLSLPAAAERLDPIHWTLTMEPSWAPPSSQVLGKLQAKMDAGWHVYSLTTPRPPIATTIAVADNPAFGPAQVFQPKPERKLDPNFNSETETFGGDTTFLIRIPVAGSAAPGETEVTAQVRYQSCNDRMCLPPIRRTVTAKLGIDPAAKAGAIAIPAGYVAFGPPAATASAAPSSAPAPAGSGQQAQGLGAFLAVAFGFGLAAIFTPCVFPMIPITMSFFLKKEAATRGQSIFQAAVFALGIVALFTLLGLAATAILGPFGVVQLGSSPWVNGLIAVVFTAFALSLLGAFEITIPSSVLTRLERASRGGGIFGTLLMGLTFSLTSFACVGPFVGTLLAASVGGGGLQPALGMLAFSAGLASPFFFLALFPSMLQRMPRSGGWLARVKVVLGFVILAAALKYVGSIDQVFQWNFLTRERFLGAWVVLFALPGLYLLGFLRLEGVKPDEPLGVGRLLTGAAFLVFAVSLIPGMWGARLGELDAYVPAPSAAPGEGLAAGGGLVWIRNDYEAALARARRENKPLLVAFTGYACANCHWMKANMFPRPEVVAVLKELILVELYTDGPDRTSQRNQQLEEKQFSTIAIPYYALMEGDGKVLATFAGLTRNPQEFLAFLNRRSAPLNAS